MLGVHPDIFVASQPAFLAERARSPAHIAQPIAAETSSGATAISPPLAASDPVSPPSAPAADLPTAEKASTVPRPNEYVAQEDSKLLSRCSTCRKKLGLTTFVC